MILPAFLSFLSLYFFITTTVALNTTPSPTSGPFNPANPGKSPIHIVPAQGALLSPNRVNALLYRYVAAGEGTALDGIGGVVLTKSIWKTITATGLGLKKRDLNFGITPIMGIVGAVDSNIHLAGKMLFTSNSQKTKMSMDSSTTVLPTATPTSTRAVPTSFLKTRDAPAPSNSLSVNMNCVDSSGNDTVINSLLYYGGIGATVFLCPSALILLTAPVFFYAANQTIATYGFPSDSTRATLKVTGTNQSNAIYGSFTFTSGCAIRNIQVDGSRDGAIANGAGLALIEMGGENSGQVIDSCHVYEPRGWSCLHGIEGFDLSCTGMVITNNQIGPAGHAPNNGLQFRKKDSVIYPPGQWADGISIACKGSFVGGNVITDATDGGIVIFGSPGTVVAGNTVISDKRQLLGGINQVDWAPFAGSFMNTLVENNFIHSNASMIKVGIAIGPLNWGTDNRTVARTYGGTTRGNTFSSGTSPTGFFGYSIAVASVGSTTVLDNSYSKASYGGSISAACFPLIPNPSPQPFIYDPYTTPSALLQGNFLPAPHFLLTICNGPGPIIKDLISG